MDELMLDEIHEEKRIKVRSADIVVRGTLEKPYYEIKYQTTDGEWHMGYSSRKLEYVFWWLDNCFEIISYEQEIRNKAIEEFLEEAMKQFTEFDLKHGYPTVTDCKVILHEVAEEMKEVRK